MTFNFKMSNDSVFEEKCQMSFCLRYRQMKLQNCLFLFFFFFLWHDFLFFFFLGFDAVSFFFSGKFPPFHSTIEHNLRFTVLITVLHSIVIVPNNEESSNQIWNVKANIYTSVRHISSCRCSYNN